MSISRQELDHGVLVRFWSIDHYRAEALLWPVSNWPKLVFSLEGTLHVETSRQLHVLPSNRALYVPAHEPHPARTLGKAKVRTLYFAPDRQIHREPGVLEVRPLLRELISEACQVGPLVATDDQHCALATLLRSEVTTASHFPTSIPMPHSHWLKQWATAYLENPTQVLPRGYSRRTIERKVLAETSLTLGQWCQQARALAGLQSLSKGSTVQEAAVDAGFETTSGFIQSFRRQFGTTPGSMQSSS